MTSIFEGKHLKTRPELQPKQGAPFGFQVCELNELHVVLNNFFAKVWCPTVTYSHCIYILYSMDD